MPTHAIDPVTIDGEINGGASGAFVAAAVSNTRDTQANLIVLGYGLHTTRAPFSKATRAARGIAAELQSKTPVPVDPMYNDANTGVTGLLCCAPVRCLKVFALANDAVVRRNIDDDFSSATRDVNVHKGKYPPHFSAKEAQHGSARWSCWTGAALVASCIAEAHRLNTHFYKLVRGGSPFGAVAAAFAHEHFALPRHRSRLRTRPCNERRRGLHMISKGGLNRSGSYDAATDQC